jgi:hypothetical protein
MTAPTPERCEPDRSIRPKRWIGSRETFHVKQSADKNNKGYFECVVAVPA